MLKAYELAFRICSGMNPLMAAATQQDQVSKVCSKFWELSPTPDVMDFVHCVRLTVRRSASLANPSISCPDAGAYALPVQRGKELLMLSCDPTSPSWIVGTRPACVSASRRTKASSGIDRGDELAASALLADQTHLPRLLIRTAARSKSICTFTATGHSWPRRGMFE